MPSGKIVDIKTQDEINAILEKENNVVIDFWAEFCAPCKAMNPILQEVIKEVNVTICKVNIEDHPNIASQYGVVSIPTFHLYHKGKKLDERVGRIMKDEFVQWIESALPMNVLR
jgi:thioredoxin 1